MKRRSALPAWPREWRAAQGRPVRGNSPNQRFPGMRFLGIAESIGPMWVFRKSWGRSAASRWSAPGPAQGRDGRGAPCSSSAMSSGRLFLDRVARQQSPSPLHRQPDHKTLDEPQGRIYHRTVTASFPPCLTEGVHPKIRVHPCSSAASIYVPSLIGRRSTLMNPPWPSPATRRS